jgi:magnesium chelatase family protein
MAFARTCAVALVGVEGVVVEVQADLEPGVAAFTLVGLPDKSLSEARDRVRAAVVNSGEEWPQRKLTVGLSPASVPKGGSSFDLAVACAVLGAAERIAPGDIADVLMLGELGLDGRVRPVRGVLPAVLAAAEAGYRHVVVPEGTAAEAALVPGMSVLGVRTLRQLIAILNDEAVPDEPPDDAEPGRAARPPTGLTLPGAGVFARPATAERPLDMADVAGQTEARKALEIAAAGGHHLYLMGPPGAGKTMLAERLPGLLPPLTAQEALEVTAVHSVAGTLPAGKPLVDVAPYCAPHHSASMPAIVGGGSGLPRPGAVSLAHRGVLFLDFSNHCVGARVVRPSGCGSSPVSLYRPRRFARRRGFGLQGGDASCGVVSCWVTTGSSSSSGRGACRTRSSGPQAWWTTKPTASSRSTREAAPSARTPTASSTMCAGASAKG